MKRALLIPVLLASAPAAAQSFSGLGFLPGDSRSWGLDISEDGRTVIGQGAVGTTTPHHWRWTSASGIQTLGGLVGYTEESNPGGVSRDGAIVTGFVTDTRNHLAYLWTPGGIAPLDGGTVSGGPVGISGNGVVAFGSSLDTTAFRWTQSAGRQSLGPLLGTPLGAVGHSFPMASSYDGAVIVGSADAFQSVIPPIQIPTPFRWTAQTGMQAMLQSNGQLFGGAATDVSSDGAIIVGFQGNGSTFFRWTQPGGYQLITPFAGIHDNFNVHISGDGSTIIGLDTYWTAAIGRRHLTDVLTAAGCDFSGWTITGATGISFDGLTLCGEGIDPLGQREAWIATVPAPATALPLLAAALARRRRR